jgi:hypothetical protein
VTVTIGVDVGQRRDPTAICVSELDWRPPAPADRAAVTARRQRYLDHLDLNTADGLRRASEREPSTNTNLRTDDHHVIRHLERLPLGTSYPAVARRVGEIVAGVAAKAGAVPVVFVDATGVGQGPCDLLTEAGVRHTPVYFTHGDKRTEEAGTVKLGKAWLVSRLQALLQTGRIHLPRSTEAEALAAELLDYEIRVDEDGNDKYGAFKVGTHDDLVTALGLAVQVAPRPMRLVVL